LEKNILFFYIPRKSSSSESSPFEASKSKACPNVALLFHYGPEEADDLIG